MRQLQPQVIQQLDLDDPDWQQLCQKLRTSTTLVAIVLSAWQMALWSAKLIVEQQLTERAQATLSWNCCRGCGTPLVSKGFVKRQMLTLVGQIEWKRRVGRCPRRCPGSQHAPFDEVLRIKAYQQVSIELSRLGCLLAVFLPFEMASRLLRQLTGSTVSDASIWNWVQGAGQQAIENLKLQLQHLADGHQPPVESLDAKLLTMPLIIAADGVTVPFRPQPKSSFMQDFVAGSEDCATGKIGQAPDESRRNGDPLTSTSISSCFGRYQRSETSLTTGSLETRSHDCASSCLDFRRRTRLLATKSENALF